MAKYVKTDRFGRPFQNIKCKMNKNGYPSGYWELGSKLYKIEPSMETTTDNKSGEDIMWVRITKVDKNNKKVNMG